MKSNKIKHAQHIEECVEYILENKCGWTQFTTWAREKYGINNRHANQLWKDTWEVMSEDFDDRIKHTVNQTLTELEQLKEASIIENDRRVWLEVIKYQNKIKGGEIERSQVEVKGELNINLNWGSENLNTIDSEDVE